MAGPGCELGAAHIEDQQHVNHSDVSTAAENMPSEKPKISTLVFMDLESTGLPMDVGKRNVHITEMCMVAIDRKSFEVDKKLRVLNKISLCVRPRFPISPGSMMVTGLYNDILESQTEFDDSVPKLMEYFFRRLQKPICLLAHNGNRFDFPVLQAELNRVNYALGSDIVCADTLVAFRTICLLHKQAIVAAEKDKKVKDDEMHSKMVKSCESISLSEEDIDSLLSEDLEIFVHIDDALLAGEKAVEPVLSNVEKKFEVTASPQVKSDNTEFLSPTQDEKTPQKSNSTVHLNENKKIRKRKIVDTTYHPRKEYNKKRILPVKRNLFPEESNRNSFPLEVHKITKFSLENLYNHFFHETPPNSHYAEVDCISLSKVCQKVSADFLEWIDNNSVAFSTIPALW